MANYQDENATATHVDSRKSFGTTLDYQLLGTYTGADFHEICNDVATHCHCSLSLLPDLHHSMDEMGAYFHLAYAQFEMTGFTDSSEGGIGQRLNVVLLENRTERFDHTVTQSLSPDRMDFFADNRYCYVLNASGHYLQKWGDLDITCLMFIFANKDKDAMPFSEYVRGKMPFFNCNLTHYFFDDNLSPLKKKTGRATRQSAQSQGPSSFLRDIVRYVQQKIKENNIPKSLIFQ